MLTCIGLSTAYLGFGVLDAISRKTSYDLDTTTWEVSLNVLIHSAVAATSTQDLILFLFHRKSLSAPCTRCASHLCSRLFHAMQLPVVLVDLAFIFVMYSALLATQNSLKTSGQDAKLLMYSRLLTVLYANVIAWLAITLLSSAVQ